MQGTNRPYIKRGNFFQKVLYLYPVFPDDTEIISTCFARPIFVCIQRTEFTEGVGRKEGLPDNQKFNTGGSLKAPRALRND